MKTRLFAPLLLAFLLTASPATQAQDTLSSPPSPLTSTQLEQPAASDTSDFLSPDELIGATDMAQLEAMELLDGGGSLHSQLKSKFVEGSAGFMSLVALALVLGLAFCIERIIYLTLAEIDAKRLLRDIGQRVDTGDIAGAAALCRDTRGPVATICQQGLAHAAEPMDTVERTIISYGAVQSAKLEKGCSWIRLFIAMAPSLGFLGTVIGMVMAFDQIQEVGDISPTVVASGMKVALITTIFGIIVALILQVFYNYILSKIEHLTSQMEESAITLLDIIQRHQLRQSATATI